MSSICGTLDSQIFDTGSFIERPVSFHKSKAATRQVAEKLALVSRDWSTAINLSVLGVCLTVITAVAAYDVYWSFKTQAILQETEQNPLGTMLINMDGGDIALFMTCKMLGTMFVILAVPAMYAFRRWWGLTGGISLAIYQTLVFLYLNFGHLLFPA